MSIKSTDAIIAAVITIVGISASSWYTANISKETSRYIADTSKDIKFKRIEFEKTWREKDEYQRNLANFLECKSEVRLIRERLSTQLYGAPHREISICTRFLKSQVPHGKIKNYNLLGWFEKYKKEKRSVKFDENETIDLSKKKLFTQVNDCLSVVRNNMAYIKSLLEEYVEIVPTLTTLGSKIDTSFKTSLISNGDKERIVQQYLRFVKTVKPFDGSVPNDIDHHLYDEKNFKILLGKCLKDERNEVIEFN
jgi:hypothetical protein